MIYRIGFPVWELMSIEEKKEKELSMMHELTESLAPRTLEILSDEEKRRLRIFVWTGCGMHKDLNAVKGGVLMMQEEWKRYGVAPVLLANKDNSAVLELAEEDGLLADCDERHAAEETPAEKRAREVSKSGGIQIGYLTGCLLNDKDDKKGQTILS